MNGPLKFLTACKILPLLDFLAKFKRVLACSCSPNFCVACKIAKQIFYFCSCSQKNRSAWHACEYSQRPFITPYRHKQAILFTSITLFFFLILFLIMHPEPSIFDYENKCENKTIYVSSLFTNFLLIFLFFSSLLRTRFHTSYYAKIWNECNACCAGSF